MRIDFIDGLRGLSALGVVYVHYCTLFNPFIPMGFYNHAAIVCEFFVISGFVLSYRFWKNQDSEQLTSSSLRRYVRLTSAPLVSILISYLLMKFSLYRHVEIFNLTGSTEMTQAFFNFEPKLYDALYESLWGMYFSYHQPESYSPVLWTMQWELKGSLLTAAFLALFGKVRRRWILYLILLIISIDTLYPTFIFGVMFSDLLYSKEGRQLHESLKKQKFLAISLFCIGAFLSIYASDFPTDIYKNLEFEFLRQNGINSDVFYHMVSAVMIMYAVIHLNILKKTLSWKVLTKIGEYSFSLYLIHIQVVCSVGAFVFLEIYNRGYDMTTCILFGSLSAILVTIPAAILLHRYVDMPAAKLAKRVQKFFE